MKFQERHFWLGFNIFPGIGPKRFYELMHTFGSAKKAWTAAKTELFTTSIPHSIIDKFLLFREQIDLNTEILRLEKRLIDFIILEDKNYPFNLKKITKPPPLLYIKGQLLPTDVKALAVVGTRLITPYGREVTEKFVTSLVLSGFTIISGLARGVDSVSHRVALGNNGRTIAVLGSGLDKIYPPEHKVLAEKIVNLAQGAILSQVQLGTAAFKGNFPSRNRIISGLSLGALVIEGASKSGAKITCEYAFQQKRPVFAVPGPITSALSEGPADLIKNGARLVTRVEDILKVIKVSSYVPLSGTSEDKEISREKKIIKFNSSEQEKIWQLLSGGNKHIDEIIRTTGFSSGNVLSCLTTMELAGMVKNIGNGNYIII